MVTKGKLAKLFVSLGVKGILCIICLASVTAALVTYTSSITATPTMQLKQGITTSTWTLYVNEVDQVRYLPGGFSQETVDAENTSTYCFAVTTDANKVCAVKIQLVSAMDSAKFSRFDLTVRSSTGGAWSNETIYNAATGTNNKASIDGLTLDDAAYVHQGNSATKYYEVMVTYSYDKVDSEVAIPITVQLTPLPLNSFT
jgi:hypothetical protein